MFVTGMHESIDLCIAINNTNRHTYTMLEHLHQSTVKWNKYRGTGVESCITALFIRKAGFIDDSRRC
jgi:hypothetical protein